MANILGGADILLFAFGSADILLFAFGGADILLFAFGSADILLFAFGGADLLQKNSAVNKKRQVIYGYAKNLSHTRILFAVKKAPP